MAPEFGLPTAEAMATTPKKTTAGKMKTARKIKMQISPLTSPEQTKDFGKDICSTTEEEKIKIVIICRRLFIQIGARRAATRTSSRVVLICKSKILVIFFIIFHHFY